ncbi:uncharacterized protein LOC105914037 [Setaria italica]|uniref:uncharacterized protein LOC105914037 n=1 Tax=Setaria italica TaxID=4555 RepID=UPI0006475021|nr:uncharacterized protein LOC105914037 [Setaria italica]
MEQTARALWLTIEGLFRTNKQSWAIFLSHDFHSMTQGDSSISEYCQRMKNLADALRDIGHPIQDSQVVLNLLRGLNPRYSNTVDDIANSTTGFMSLTQAHDMLTLKELRLANEEKISNSTALLTRTSSSSLSSDCTGGCRPLSGPIQIGGSRGGGKKRWQKKGDGSFQAPSGGGNGPPWPTDMWFCFSPGVGSYGTLGHQQAGSQYPTGGGSLCASTPSLPGPPL